MEMNSIPSSPVLRYATPLPMNRTPVSTVALQHKSVSSVLWYATPLPINMTPVSTVGGPFPPFCGTPGLVSIGCSVQAGWLPRVPLPPDEHDAFRCLPMNTRTTQFLRSDPAMYTSPGRTYARVGVRAPARMYVRGHIFFLAPWPLYVHVHATCAPLLRHVRAYTMRHALPYSTIVHRCRLQTDRPTSMYVHVRDQNDNATYASTR